MDNLWLVFLGILGAIILSIRKLFKDDGGKEYEKNLEDTPAEDVVDSLDNTRDIQSVKNESDREFDVTYNRRRELIRKRRKNLLAGFRGKKTCRGVEGDKE